jgi:hypothetical protein
VPFEGVEWVGGGVVLVGVGGVVDVGVVSFTTGVGVGAVVGVGGGGVPVPTWIVTPASDGTNELPPEVTQLPSLVGANVAWIVTFSLVVAAAPCTVKFAVVFPLHGVSRYEPAGTVNAASVAPGVGATAPVVEAVSVAVNVVSDAHAKSVSVNDIWIGIVTFTSAWAGALIAISDEA